MKCISYDHAFEQDIRVKHKNRPGVIPGNHGEKAPNTQKPAGVDVD